MNVRECFCKACKACKAFGTISDCAANAGIVGAGSFTRPTTAVAGDNIHADYGPLGTVSFRFV